MAIFNSYVKWWFSIVFCMFTRPGNHQRATFAMLASWPCRVLSLDGLAGCEAEGMAWQRSAQWDRFFRQTFHGSIGKVRGITPTIWSSSKMEVSFFQKHVMTGALCFNPGLNGIHIPQSTLYWAKPYTPVYFLLSSMY